MKWPIDYNRENERRHITRRIFDSTDEPRKLSIQLYADNPCEFINDWCITYDPRNPTKVDPHNLDKKLPAKMPFVPFDKQNELVEFFLACMNGQESGLVEKCRDMGATWIACCFSVWVWLYIPGSAVGWGSRKEALVDRLGDPSSIFEKIRMIILNLPDYILPEGFNDKDHCNFMKITGGHGATITGEAGDNIGRGGRTSIYFKDESAYYERPELIEAALGDNTDCQIDISSVNGPNNIFHRKRQSGTVKVFIMDWRDHPAKDQAWYDKRREDAESQGLMHIFSQEVDRDYNSSVEGVLIPGIWVKASVDAHLKLGIEIIGKKRAGFDVADEGDDVNAIISKHGVLINDLETWGVGDTHESTARALQFCERHNIEDMVYDSVGVGAGVKAAVRIITSPVTAMSYSGVGVMNPEKEYVEGKKNKDMFASGSAQDWWLLRDCFLHTYNAVVKNKDFDEDKIISLSSDLPHLQQLTSELSQVVRSTNARGLILIDKKPKGIKSPNLADSLKMTCSNVSQAKGPNFRRL